MKVDLIVSRHPAATKFVAAELGGYVAEDGVRIPDGEIVIPVLTSATPDDVRGKTVAGNLPLHLAALCSQVIAIEFAGPPPRGQEYSFQDMRASGARLVGYVVRPVGHPDLHAMM